MGRLRATLKAQKKWWDQQRGLLMADLMASMKPLAMQMVFAKALLLVAQLELLKEPEMELWKQREKQKVPHSAKLEN